MFVRRAGVGRMRLKNQLRFLCLAFVVVPVITVFHFCEPSEHPRWAVFTSTLVGFEPSEHASFAALISSAAWWIGFIAVMLTDNFHSKNDDCLDHGFKYIGFRFFILSGIIVDASARGVDHLVVTLICTYVRPSIRLATTQSRHGYEIVYYAITPLVLAWI